MADRIPTGHLNRMSVAVLAVCTRRCSVARIVAHPPLALGWQLGLVWRSWRRSPWHILSSDHCSA